jgi:hypothetical protein
MARGLRQEATVRLDPLKLEYLLCRFVDAAFNAVFGYEEIIADPVPCAGADLGGVAGHVHAGGDLHWLVVAD